MAHWIGVCQRRGGAKKSEHREVLTLEVYTKMKKNMLNPKHYDW